MERAFVRDRTHRTGKVDYVVNYATRAANVQYSAAHRDKGSAYLAPRARSKDELSVCSGEPLFTPRQEHHKSFAAVSGPDRGQCLSSLNGLSFDQATKIWDKDPSSRAKLLRETVSTRVLAYSGIAVTHWDYESVGRQQDQFVATVGGMNTIYCDADCQTGDLLAVDLPLTSELAEILASGSGGITELEYAAPSSPAPRAWGFCKLQRKRGVPNGKCTLAIRPWDESVPLEWVIGRVYEGAPRGGRVGVVLGASGIGLVRQTTRAPAAGRDAALLKAMNEARSLKPSENVGGDGGSSKEKKTLYDAEVVPRGGGGNCLFHSLAYGLQKTNDDSG